MQGIIGMIFLFAGNYVPVLHLECNGQLISITQYSQLYKVIGTNYGGDGVTTFALPNLTSVLTSAKYVVCFDGYFPTPA